MSHPSRVRGLKPYLFILSIKVIIVAPITGAWIETWLYKRTHDKRYVAPITGAWIETPCKENLVRCYLVAPITGAWIETTVLALVVAINTT